MDFTRNRVTRVSMMDELRVLLRQLEELLLVGPVDEDECLELAALAGMIENLGGSATATLDKARSWRDGWGSKRLAEAWETWDEQELLEALKKAVTQEDAAGFEEALLDFDELMNAANWCDQEALLLGPLQSAKVLMEQAPAALQAQAATLLERSAS